MRTATTERLLANLEEQIDFLRTSCALYDDGKEHEAKRIALSVRVLVHDKGAGESLLGQLGVKDTLEFVDTSRTLQMTPTFEKPVGLTVAVMEPGNEHFEPVLDAYRSDNRVPFEEWWGAVLIRPVDHRHREQRGERPEFTRRDIILGTANQEGGAHIAPDPSRWWRDLRDQDYLGALAFPSGVPVPNRVPATNRQIGWEVLKTLKRLERSPVH